MTIRRAPSYVAIVVGGGGSCRLTRTNSPNVPSIPGYYHQQLSSSMRKVCLLDGDGGGGRLRLWLPLWLSALPLPTLKPTLVVFEVAKK